MPVASSDGIEICFETSGDPSDPALLLVAGLGMQLVGWGSDFVERLAGAGFFVVAYDNRDVGLSTHLADAGAPDFMAVLGGDASSVPYSIPDLARDGAGLLDALGIASCHLVGLSLGGMIAQQLAIDYPERVASLCSIMSTTGAPGVGQPSDDAAEALLRPAPASARQAADQAVEIWKVIGSPAYPIDEARVRKLAELSFTRSNGTAGVARQLGALLVAPDRTTGLGSVRVPTLVMHGSADPLVAPSGGEATAAAVPGARLVVYDGMGHELPPQLFDEMIGQIRDNAALSTSSRPL